MISGGYPAMEVAGSQAPRVFRNRPETASDHLFDATHSSLDLSKPFEKRISPTAGIAKRQPPRAHCQECGVSLNIRKARGPATVLIASIGDVADAHCLRAGCGRSSCAATARLPAAGPPCRP